MNGRIKELRKTLGLTLEKFGNRLGVGKTAISKLEKGERNVTDQMFKSICREFNVNKEWLRDGTGSMFVQPDTFSLDNFVKSKGATELDIEGGAFMSNKEKVIQLLDNVPTYKMGYVLAYVQGITADEEADDIFCQRMWENYENDPDPEKDTFYSLEDCKKEWGID